MLASDVCFEHGWHEDTNAQSRGKCYLGTITKAIIANHCAVEQSEQSRSLCDSLAASQYSTKEARRRKSIFRSQSTRHVKFCCRGPRPTTRNGPTGHSNILEMTLSSIPCTYHRQSWHRCQHSIRSTKTCTHLGTFTVSICLLPKDLGDNGTGQHLNPSPWQHDVNIPPLPFFSHFGDSFGSVRPSDPVYRALFVHPSSSPCLCMYYASHIPVLDGPSLFHVHRPPKRAKLVGSGPRPRNGGCCPLVPPGQQSRRASTCPGLLACRCASVPCRHDLPPQGYDVRVTSTTCTRTDPAERCQPFLVSQLDRPHTPSALIYFT